MKLASEVGIYSKINTKCLLHMRYSAQSSTNGLKKINVVLGFMKPFHLTC